MFALRRGPLGNFDVSSLTPEQSALFLGGTATVAANGTKIRTLYVWESDADRNVYVYTERGQILASYPPPEDYDPYILARKQIESGENLSEERIEWLVKSLDPTRVVACVTVADGALPAAPPLLQPEISPQAPLPGGFRILEGGEGEPALSVTTLSQEPGYDWVLHLNSPGIDTRIPVWRGDDESLPTSGWGTPETRTISSARDSIWKDISDEHSSGLRLRYYFTPYLDTTYVQAPSAATITVKYVTTRSMSPTAYLWDDWANRRTIENITPSSITYQGYTAFIYEAQFTQLTPDTIYKYTFEWAAGADTFRTSVPTVPTWPNPQDIGDFSFVVYGDNRYTDSTPTFNTVHRDVACLGILADPRPTAVAGPRFVLHVGDLVYDGGHADEWIQHFFRPAGAVASRLPVFPCVGNHETREDAGVTKYTALFSLPQNATKAEHKERYYWFNYGDCYFVVLDTNLPFGVGSDQYNWLVGSKGCLTWTEFLNARRLFILLHCPPYTDSSDSTHPWHATDVTAVRTTLAPIFESSTSPRVHRKADVVLSGHNHFYERSLYNGVHYIVTGGGGAELHTPISPPLLGHNVGQQKAAKAFHYCRMDVPGAGALHLTVRTQVGALIEKLDLD
jgi:hypothetical protein